MYILAFKQNIILTYYTCVHNANVRDIDLASSVVPL